jgi:hypothetical protein
MLDKSGIYPGFILDISRIYPGFIYIPDKSRIYLKYIPEYIPNRSEIYSQIYLGSQGWGVVRALDGVLAGWRSVFSLSEGSWGPERGFGLAKVDF